MRFMNKLVRQTIILAVIITMASPACGTSPSDPGHPDAEVGDATGDAGTFLTCAAATPLTWLADGNNQANDARFSLTRVRTTSGPLSEYAAGHLYPSQSFFFDGTSCLAASDAPNSFFDELDATMSVELWMQIPYGTAPSAANGRLIDKTTGAGASATGFSLSLDNARVRFAVGPATWLSAPVPIATTPGTDGRMLGQWVHVIGTYLDHTPRVFIDGVASGSVETTSHAIAVTNDASLRIGGDQSGNSRFSGRIDNIRIYCTALSAMQIRERFMSEDPR